MRRDRYPGQPKFPFVPGYGLVSVAAAMKSAEWGTVVGKVVLEP